MKLYYDLHIHTALSPCGEESMTPNNIVNMALLCGLDVIAITDHNTCANVEPIIKIGNKKDLLVIPGIEIETKEEIHILGLFLKLEDAYKVQEIVYSTLPVKNESKLFKQEIYNDKDIVIGELDKLLMTASALSLKEVIQIINKNNGIAIPAHIDRLSYSIVSNLGFIPTDLNISTIEVSRFSNLDDYKSKYKNYNLIQSSDAHELGYIGITRNFMQVEKKSLQCILEALKDRSK